MEQVHFYGLVTRGIVLLTKTYWTEAKDPNSLSTTKSVIKFDKPLLDKVFYRTLQRGLSRTYVVEEIRHLLRTSVSDEELIFELTEATAAEKERVAV